jgi:hypothetical protein
MGFVIDTMAFEGQNGPVLVAFNISGHPFVAQMTRDFIDTSGFTRVGYASTDCSGTPLVQAVPSQLIPPAGIAGPGTTVYWADPGGTPQPVMLNSFIQVGGTCISSGVSDTPVLPATFQVDLSTLFTPPFSVR